MNAARNYEDVVAALDLAVREGRAPSWVQHFLRDVRGSEHEVRFIGSNRGPGLARMKAVLAECAGSEPDQDELAPLLQASIALARGSRRVA